MCSNGKVILMKCMPGIIFIFVTTNKKRSSQWSNSPICLYEASQFRLVVKMSDFDQS